MAGAVDGAMDPPGLHVARFTRWLRRERPDLAGAGPIRATLLTGGRSNLTYRLDGGARPLVLRRPPLGHVQATAHDMAREHRVIAALAATPVPVPEALALHDDTDGSAGTGTPFYLMSFVPGEVLARPEQNAGYAPAELHALGLELAGLLARLHAVEPEAVGLGDLGRRGGFLDRQLRIWGRQYAGSRSRALPALDDLQTRLRDRVPTTRRTCLVHGDFRLDNALVARDTEGRPGVAAILDWEMSTLGDAALDLATFVMYWEISRVAPGATVSAVDPAVGYPSVEELLDHYAAHVGDEAGDLSWYRAFAAYKLAVILEGVHFRYLQGGTVGDGFDLVGDLVAPLAEDGLEHLAQVRTS